jgi:hypothetical protein
MVDSSSFKFTTGKLIGNYTNSDTGIVLDTERRREHSYLDTRVHLQILWSTGTITWIGADACFLIENQGSEQ